MQKLSALVITYNEEENIRRCLDSIAFADEIIIVDSYSTDTTLNILKDEYPQVKVFQHKFEDFTKQKTYTLSLANNDWVLFLDADEEVTVALREEIYATLKDDQKPHVAYWFYRQFMFNDKKLRFSGWQTDKNVRLFRKSKCQFEGDRIVHEQLQIDGSLGKFKNKLIHYSYSDYEDYKRKMIKYGQLRAQEEFRKGKKSNLFLKIFRPTWKFFNHYIIRLGILDGKKGIIISHLNALGVHSRYVTLAKLWKENKAT
ncbi:glycosyltransferase family 2 protein [Sungkyunkwania multivorans]|uniref:Glycosyltransferase family 2 protein n=1 Tax=Sungkyunkwania multivorans TaxID=1173618 RepID=A0ABW3CXG0_9FLAO